MWSWDSDPTQVTGKPILLQPPAALPRRSLPVNSISTVFTWGYAVIDISCPFAGQPIFFSIDRKPVFKDLETCGYCDNLTPHSGPGSLQYVQTSYPFHPFNP